MWVGRVRIRFGSETEFLEVVHSCCVSSVKILSDGPALLQQSTGNPGECLHGCWFPFVQGLSPEPLFACHMCVHQRGVMVLYFCTLLPSDNHVPHKGDVQVSVPLLHLSAKAPKKSGFNTPRPLRNISQCQ